MDIIEYLLDGLEAELALERELGVRAVPFDRSLLTPQPEAAPAAAAAPAPTRAAAPAAAPAPKAPPAADRFDFVFLHHRQLSARGGEMMDKIVAAMGRTADTAPVLVDPPPPKARVYVVLGWLAMRKFFPGLQGGPGQWLKTQGGADVLISYSPEYILRFAPASPELREAKASMWRSLKAVKQRVER